MTPCVFALVSSTDCPSLIKTQELLLRPVSFAAQSLSATCQDTPVVYPLSTTMQDTVSARGTAHVVLDPTFHMLHKRLLS